MEAAEGAETRYGAVSGQGMPPVLQRVVKMAENIVFGIHPLKRTHSWAPPPQ